MYGVKRKQEFTYDLFKNVDFISTSTDQFMSLGTGLIPFLEHNDANRVLMGSNMQRQSLPLIKKEMSFIQTGREAFINRESESVTLTKISGLVVYSSRNKIVIQEEFKSLEFINPFLSFNIFSNYSFNKIFSARRFVNREYYFLSNRKRSINNVYLTKNPVVNKGDWVKKGQILADSSSSLYGNLCLGRNILVGYLGWEGYNFEDAVIISDRLVHEDIFTSLHVKKYKTFIFSDTEERVRIL